MARIEKIELRMVDLVPKVKRTDAIQSFVSQETPIVTITDSDGAVGTGYSYTIGTGGSSVMRLLSDHLAPRLIGRDPDMIEAIWHDLEFATHATTIGAITAIAIAAIDTALWDLRAKKQNLPLWKLAVPAEFETYHKWDFSKFGRGERFVYKTIPHSEFDEIMDQVKRWKLDDFLTDRTYEGLAAR